MGIGRNTKSADLLIIGAGPKAAAIAAKIHVLNSIGMTSVRVLVLERSRFASTWTGKFGFTSGKELLGTRPEKDVGFPYETRFQRNDFPEIDKLMMEFSWQSYLISNHKYRRWIDCGVGHPEHREFADYLAWVFSKATCGVEYLTGNANGICFNNNHWVVDCERAQQNFYIQVDKGIIFTGQGREKPINSDSNIEGRMFTPATAQLKLEKLNLGKSARFCIVGAGESAVSMALHLIEKMGPEVHITFVAPSLPTSRGESFLENSVYSSSGLVQWHKLPVGIREDFISRTDRGVMSPTALAKLTKYKNISFSIGRVSAVYRGKSGLAEVMIDQSDEIIRLSFDAVANCIGFCVLKSIVELLGESKGKIENLTGINLDKNSDVALNLDESFSIPGLDVKLHIPALAGLAYGPGFGNLSCLGAMSDRVLSPYVLTSPQRKVNTQHNQFDLNVLD